MFQKFFLFLIFSLSSIFAEMPEPYASIKQLPFDPHGWFINAKPLDAILEQRKPKIVIEIGSWMGCSTRFIADKLPEGGKLYAIDTWAGSPGEEVHMSDPRLPYLYQQFLSNVIHAGLTNVIIPIRMNSVEASKALNIKADLIYLDGAHDTSSVIADILSWYPHLAEDGLLCGDDWGWPSVQAAVIQCSSKLNKKVVAVGNFWFFYNE